MKLCSALLTISLLSVPPLTAQDEDATVTDTHFEITEVSNGSPPTPIDDERPKAPSLLSDSLKDIPDVIDYTYTEKEGLIDFNPIEPLHNTWKPIYKFYKDKMCVDLAIAYTSLYQRATAGLHHLEAAGDDFDFLGVWTIADKETAPHPSSIGFACESRAKWTSIPPRLLGENIGSLWGTVNTFSRYDYVLIQLWWEYHLIRKKFGFRLGKIDLTDYFNLYTFISSNFSFLDQGLTGDLTVNFPDNGLAVIVGYKPTDDTFLFAGIGDMNGDRRSMCLDTFFSEHEYFTAAEFSYKPKLCNLGEGNYNVMIWHSDPIKKKGVPASRGLAVSMEQELYCGLLPFVRYGYSDGRGTGIKHALGTGLGILNPFNRKDDEFSLGLIWGRPRDSRLCDQIMCETYYRLQLTHHIQISPDIEVIFHPSYNPKNDVIGVFSIRMRMNI